MIGLYRRYCDEDDIENGYKNLVQIFPDSHCPFVLADWYSGRLSVEDEIEDDTFEIEFTLDEGYVINSERRYVGPALPFPVFRTQQPTPTERYVRHRFWV